MGQIIFTLHFPSRSKIYVSGIDEKSMEGIRSGHDWGLKLQPEESQHVESGSLIRIVQLWLFQKLRITKEFGRKREIFCSSWPIVSSDKNALKTLSWQKLKCITQGRRSCNSLECNHRVLLFPWRNRWHAALWRAWTPGVLATLTPFIFVAKMQGQWKGLVQCAWCGKLKQTEFVNLCRYHKMQQR